MPSDFVRVCAVGDVPDNQMISVEADGEPVCLAKIGGEFFAISDICSHFFTYLTSGELFPENYEVQCPLHDSKFSLRTGEPNQPPADKPVESYAVKVEGDDVLVGPKG